jgi:hypothetical protein
MVFFLLPLTGMLAAVTYNSSSAQQPNTPPQGGYTQNNIYVEPSQPSTPVQYQAPSTPQYQYSNPGYSIFTQPPPPSPSEAFPDQAEQDALYRKLQSE